jgi:hypothetical protein
MNIRIWIASVIVAAGMPLCAQSPATAPTTNVMIRLTIKPEVDRPQLMKVMPDEVRATVKLYLDGKIQQWYSLSDGKGVVFIMNCASVDEAKALMEGLPLSKAKMANLEYTGLAPLTPLRLLLGDASKQ